MSAARSPVQIAAGLREHGTRPAVRTSTSVLSYDDLAMLVERQAAQLRGGRRLVLVRAGNDLSSLVAYLGALHGGHVALLTGPGQPEHVERLVHTYDPDVVVEGGAGEPIVHQRRAGSAHVLHPDLALLLSTSGTTGSAKLVRLSGQNLDANARSIVAALDITSDDRAATSLPMHYCYGLSVFNSHLLAGASLILTDASVVDECFWSAVRAGQATSFAGVPHTFDLLDRVGFAEMSLPHLRYVTQAGGRLPPEHVRRYAELGKRAGWDLVVMYGQTEATARMAYLPPHLVLDRPAAIGVAVPGGELRVDEIPGREDGSGELVYRGPNVMLGYATGPGDLAEGATLTELRTGDLARQTADGLYEIVGRASRFVKVFGLRVDLDEVEAALARRGIPALCTGDDAGLVVAVQAPGAERTARLLVASMAGLPTARIHVTVVAELPRGATGKPDYAGVARLRDQEILREPTSVRAVFQDVLQLDEVGDDATFVELGGDSLSYVEASIRLEEVLGQLPTSWPTTPVRDLERQHSRPTRWRWLETNVVLRAAAISLVVASHVHLAEVQGGAHLLLAVAGFNFARFALATGRLARSVLRIALPSAAWIAGVALVSDEFALTHAVFLNGQLGAAGARWGYWFTEALVQMLLPLTILLGIPALRRAERSRPLVAAIVVLVVGLALRTDVNGLAGAHHRIDRPNEVLWLFAAGWVAALTTSGRQRAALCAAMAVAVPTFFGESGRALIVLGGFSVLVWLRQLPVPPAAARVAGALAGASLYIYLTHWQVFPALQPHLPAVLTWVLTLAIGVGVGSRAQRVVVAVEQLLTRLHLAGWPRELRQLELRRPAVGSAPHAREDAIA